MTCHLFLTLILLLLLPPEAFGIDLKPGESVTIQLDDDQATWTGDGFSLDCPSSRKCQINSKKLGTGTFRIVYSKTSGRKLRFGDAQLNIGGSLSEQSSEVSTAYRSEITPNSPYTVAIKKFGFLIRKSETKTIKDIPHTISLNEMIHTVPESLTYSQLSSELTSIQLGQSELKVIPSEINSVSKETFSWQRGPILFQLPSGQFVTANNFRINSIGPNLANSSFLPKILISSYRNGFIAIPIRGSFEIRESSSGASRNQGVIIQPPFAVWIEKDKKKLFSLLSCDDASDLLKNKDLDKQEFACEHFNVENQLGFNLGMIDLSDTKPDNPHAFAIFQEWLKPFFELQLDEQKRLDLQLANEAALNNRYDLKLKYWLSENKCDKIHESKPGPDEEENLKKYYQGVCAQRAGRPDSAINKWSWLIKKMQDGRANEYSSHSFEKLKSEARWQGHIGLYLGRDSNPLLKPKNEDKSPFSDFPAKNFMVYGIENQLKYQLNMSSNLKFHLMSEGDISIYSAHGKIPLLNLRQDISLPASFFTHTGETIEITPKLMGRGSGYFLESAGLGIDLGIDKSGFKGIFAVRSFEDFNNSREYFDAISGNSIDFLSSIPSHRPFVELSGLMSYRAGYNRGSWALYGQKKHSRYRFDVEQNESFSSWTLGTQMTHRVLPLITFEGESSFEQIRFHVGSPGHKIKFNLKSIWDIHPDYAASFQYEYIASKSNLLFGTWNKHQYVLGIRREFR